MAMRILNCAKHLVFTQHFFSIKESYHTSSPPYLYLILSSVGQKEVQTIQALMYVWNSPALSPFVTIETKPVSFICSLQPFLNLPESCLFSPPNLIMSVMKFFILSGYMCHQSRHTNQILVEGSILSLWSDGSNWPQEQKTEMLSLTSRCLFSLLWLLNWLCCMLVNMHFQLQSSGQLVL